MQRILVIIALLFTILAPSVAQETQDIPDIINETVPQAEAILNTAGLRLDPVILSVTVGNSDFNHVESATIDGDTVQVTVLREHNVELIWESSDAFTAQAGLRNQNLTGDELLTLVNTGDETIPLENLVLGDFSASQWNGSLLAGQCAQAWSVNISSFVLLPECDAIQPDNYLPILDSTQHFWLNSDMFTVEQNGVSRGICVRVDERCETWVSPTDIAEEITPFIYFIYDETELVIYNSTDTQWMDLQHLQDFPISLDRDTWDIVTISDTERLAPNQCVRFATEGDEDLLQTDCFEIARNELFMSEIFWDESFSFIDTLLAEKDHTCPRTDSEQTICIIGRDVE